MISYRCRNPGCGAEMLSPDSMAGRMETCPQCRTVNVVPPAAAGPVIVQAVPASPAGAAQGVQPPAATSPGQAPAILLPVQSAGVPAGTGAAPSPRRFWRVPSIVSLPAAGLLLILFFVPWVEVSSISANVTASGLQLSVGSVSAEMSFLGLPPPPGTPDPKKVKARPWFFLGLVAPLLVGVFCLLGLLRMMGTTPFSIALMTAGVAGIVVVILACSVSYAEEELIGYVVIRGEGPFLGPPRPGVPGTRAPRPAFPGAPPPGMTPIELFKPVELFKPETTGAVGMSLLLYVVVLAGGIGQLLYDGLKRPSPASPLPPPVGY
jgi:hypothetical protein